MNLISIVSPVYNSEKTISLLVEKLMKILVKITDNFEIILVDDNSSDDSWAEVVKITEVNLKVKGIKLSKNFGQHYAITAGLDYASGKWVVVMDCDLQDRPEEIFNLYKKACEGYDIVLGRRYDRRDTFSKKISSIIFYRFLSYLTGKKYDSSIANFGIYSNKVIFEINRLRESIRYFPTMVDWIGFNKTSIIISHSERTIGRTSYNFKKRVKLATDIILAYSDKPIRIVVKFGLLVSFTSFLMSIYILFKWLSGSIQVLGYSSLIISVWFLSGCILTTLGVLGLYVGKIFENVKSRPIYIIEKTKNV